MVLATDLSRDLLMSLLRTLYSPYSLELGPSPKFVISPSVHAKLISFDQWFLCHLGEVLGAYHLDSYRVYEWYLGVTHAGHPPFLLWNYFSCIAQATRF